MLHRKEPAYITIYLSLSLAVLISLCLALIEGVRSSSIRLETECVADIALNGVFAEYHRELSEQYNLFAIDSAYGSGRPAKAAVQAHLSDYIRRNLPGKESRPELVDRFLYKNFLAMYPKEVRMDGAQFVTDEDGAVFRRLAADAVRDDFGLAAAQEVKKWLGTVQEYELCERDIQKEKQELVKELLEYDGEEVEVEDAEGGSHQETLEVTDPTASLDQIRAQGVLKLVLKEGEALSGRSLEGKALLEERMRQQTVNQGNLAQTDAETDTMLERLLFGEYLVRYFGYYGNEKENGALAYQLEYLFAGQAKDVENLRLTADALLALREVANVVYLLGDEEKSKQAETLAKAVTAVLFVPELEDLVKTILIFGWAFGESVYDVSKLLEGERVVLIKDAASWHYDLKNVLLGNFLHRQEQTQGSQEEKGLSYSDYMRIFLYLAGEQTLVMRAMNLVEGDIRETPGNAGFRLDGCITGVETQITMASKYGYEYWLTRKKFYD